MKDPILHPSVPESQRAFYLQLCLSWSSALRSPLTLTLWLPLIGQPSAPRSDPMANHRTEETVQPQGPPCQPGGGTTSCPEQGGDVPSQDRGWTGRLPLESWLSHRLAKGSSGTWSGQNHALAILPVRRIGRAWQDVVLDLNPTPATSCGVETSPHTSVSTSEQTQHNKMYLAGLIVNVRCTQHIITTSWEFFPTSASF